jgi:hypothetical protein
MEEYNENKVLIADNAIRSINHLKINLAFIESCFKHLPYQKIAPATFSMSYHGNDDEYAYGIENILEDLIRCVHYQLESKIEIDIPAHLNIRQNIFLAGEEIELHYYGQLQIYYNSAWITFCEYFPDNSVQIELLKETSGTTLHELFENLQVTIAGQISRRQED